MNPLIIQAGAAAGFWSTALGEWAKGILAAVGVVLVLVALFKAAGKFLNGKVGDGVKVLILGLIIAAFCFKPDTLLGSLINTTSNVIEKVSTSVDEVGGGGGGATQ